jgi:hypothetical protein
VTSLLVELPTAVTTKLAQNCFVNGLIPRVSVAFFMYLVNYLDYLQNFLFNVTSRSLICYAHSFTPVSTHNKYLTSLGAAVQPTTMDSLSAHDIQKSNRSILKTSSAQSQLQPPSAEVLVQLRARLLNATIGHGFVPAVCCSSIVIHFNISK